MKILFNDLHRGFELHQAEYEEKALQVLRSGWYILGEEVRKFEEEFAAVNKAGYCVGVDNGLNAIALSLIALGIGEGDEVIVQSNSYIATVLAVTHTDATPVFVEPDEYYNIDAERIEEKITPRTKALLITHLYGQASNMERIAAICAQHGLFLIEDCAQAHFAEFKNKFAGTFGQLGCFSFYPTKNMGGFGDGGAVITNDEALAATIRSLRNYGSSKKYYNEYIGYNNRLDELQAGLLRVKLKHYDELREKRDEIAERYLKEIKNPAVVLPAVREGATSIWHLFVVRIDKRDEFRNYMLDQGIATDVHYPIPPHLSEAYRCLGYSEGDFPIAERYSKTVVSLPIYNGMNTAEVDYVIAAVNNYKG